MTGQRRGGRGRPDHRCEAHRLCARLVEEVEQRTGRACGNGGAAEDPGRCHEVVARIHRAIVGVGRRRRLGPLCELVAQGLGVAIAHERDDAGRDRTGCEHAGAGPHPRHRAPPAGLAQRRRDRDGFPPGEHELLAERLAAPLRETSRRRAVPWVWTGASVLAAGAITTGIVALVRDSHAQDLRDQLAQGNQAATTADDYDRTVNSRDHFVTAPWILGGAAVAAGAAGALLYFFGHPSAESVRLAPMIGPTSAAATLSGHF